MSGITIVGAGPAGLATALIVACHEGSERIEVLDPSGGWLDAWHRRFAAQAIPHLHSPAVHHPYPEPFALLEHARGEELVPSGGTQLPTTTCFARFIERTVVRAGLADAVTPLAVTGLELDASGRPALALSDGSHRRPDRVVLATNARRSLIPNGFADAVADGRVATGERADVAETPVGGHVVVVGGGLSGAHLALGAVARGATVTLLTRRRLTVRRFDTHPSWLGPKKRRPFEQEPDPAVRRRIVDGARGGGTIPHSVRRRMTAAIHDERLELRERVVPLEVIPQAERLPVLDADLSWPGTHVHLVGFTTALTLGPTAGNLVGQRRAAARIGARLRGEDPVRTDRVVTGAGACPRMHQSPTASRRRVDASR